MENEGKSILSQAERSFFTLRYAVPGFTFILISVLASYPVLKEILFVEANVTLAGAFLAFFSLLGGGAVGFLVSQIWYVFDYVFLYGNYSKQRELRKDLREEYNISDNRFDQVLFLNNLFHNLSDKRTQYYSQRRYDLYHTCGSTLFATISGYGFGLLIRTRILKVHAFTTNYDCLVLLLSICLSIILACSLWIAAREHARIIDKAVREMMRVHHGP